MKRFIECYLPVTACNLRCSYCYVMQESRRAMRIEPLKYSIETIQRAMTKERFGGECYISICGAGETLLPDYAVPLVKALLENGHFLNVTTNGTLTKRFKEIVDTYTKDELERLNISFSLHYLELKRLHLLDAFFENIAMIRAAGCSFVLQLNLCDEYIPYLDEIKSVCMERVGALPQVAATRREDRNVTKVELLTDRSPEEYIRLGQTFDSPLFDCTIRNFNVKRKEFCYAGEWSFVLSLESGRIRRCYASCVFQNIFEDTSAPLRSLAVGKHCNCLYCMNSSHFMSQGVIPQVECPSYADLRNRKTADGGEWYSPRMKAFLSEKLYDKNESYPGWKKAVTGVVGVFDTMAYWLYSKLHAYQTRNQKNKG